MVNTNNNFNESNRKNYKVQFDCEGEEVFYYLSLTPDQVRLLDWLKEYVYDIDYKEQAKVIVI